MPITAYLKKLKSQVKQHQAALTPTFDSAETMHGQTSFQGFWIRFTPSGGENRTHDQ